MPDPDVPPPLTCIKFAPKCLCGTNTTTGNQVTWCKDHNGWTEAMKQDKLRQDADDEVRRLRTTASQPSEGADAIVMMHLANLESVVEHSAQGPDFFRSTIRDGLRLLRVLLERPNRVAPNAPSGAIEAARALLKALPPIDRHAEWSRKHAANSPSGHQEFIRDDNDDFRAYRAAVAALTAALATAGSSVGRGWSVPEEMVRVADEAFVHVMRAAAAEDVYPDKFDRVVAIRAALTAAGAYRVAGSATPSRAHGAAALEGK